MKIKKMKKIEGTRKFYTARTDRAFKATIGKEEHKRMLEEFLKRTLKKDLKIVKYLRNEQPVEDMKDKIRIVDLLVQLENKEYIHVELNNVSEANWEDIKKRNFIYVATDYSRLVQRGDIYSSRTPVLAIDLTYGLGTERPLVDHYYYQNDKGEKYIDDFGTMVLNMDKVMYYWYNNIEEEVQENKHLIMLDCGPDDLKLLSKGDKLVEEYTDAITKLNTDNHFRQIMTIEEENAKMEKTNLKRAEEKGHASGLQEGQAVLIKSLIDSGMSIEEISSRINISIEDINALIQS